MFSIRRLALMGVCRTKCPALPKISGSQCCVPQLRNVLLEAQLPNGMGCGRRSFCRRTSENQHFDEHVDEDEELREYQEEDNASSNEEEEEKKKQKAEIFEEISKGDPGVLKTLKLLDLEIAFLRSQGWRVPDYVSKRNWEDLLQLKSLSQRKKHLGFLRLKEFKALSDKEKKKRRNELATKEKEEAGFHYYGLNNHSMFMRIYDRSLNRLLHLRQQIHPGLKIVLDCSYEEYMSDINLKACAKQIIICGYYARYHRQPSQISVCGLHEKSHLRKLLPKYAPNFLEGFGPSIYKEDLLTAFPKERLVYLTPDSANELVFNPEDIFVIGAFVDKGIGIKVSSAKARTSRIRHAKLPIDSYVRWRQGTKSLPLNTVLKILLDMGFYSDWNKAFENLPRRCLKDPSQMPVQDETHQSRNILYKTLQSN